MEREGTSTINGPILEDQIRNYRRTARIRHALNRVVQRNKQLSTLRQQVDPDRELQISQRRRANMVPAEVLYEGGSCSRKHKVYQHYHEQRILCTDGQQEVLPFITEQSYNKLKQENYQHIHHGLILIRIHALHKRFAGTKVLIMLTDERWTNENRITAAMEVDMTSGTQLVYISPQMMTSLDDFYRHIKLIIQTQGYESWTQGESNLLITRGLVGRLSNEGHVGFKYNVPHVAEYLQTQGIQALPGVKMATAELQGKNWKISIPPKDPISTKPTALQVNTHIDGSMSVRFSSYQRHNTSTQAEPYSDEDEELALPLTESKPDWYQFSQSKRTYCPTHQGPYTCKEDYKGCNPWELLDLEGYRLHQTKTMQEQILMVTEEGVTIQKLETDAILPTRMTDGSAGYDLYATHSATIDPHERIKICTNLMIAIPKGLFGQIKSRSSMAFFRYLDVVAGTIDSDYRGNLAVILHNSGTKSQQILKGERIAQLLFLPIVHPDINETTSLPSSSTHLGFGSTNQTYPEGGGGTDEDSSEDELTGLNAYWEDSQPPDEPQYDASEDELKSEKAFPAQQSSDPLKRLQNKLGELGYSSTSVISRYNPPEETMDNAPIRASASNANQIPRQSIFNTERIRNRVSNFRGGNNSEQWELPSAQQQTGAMLVLPPDITLWHDVISRWESITINLVNDRAWDDNKAKMLFIERLLGEREKRIWEQWRTQYIDEYARLITAASDPQNVTNHIRQVFLLENPYTGSTAEQNRALRDLERLSCTDIKYIFQYSIDYLDLASRTGRMYDSPELSNKYFMKMPTLLGEELAEAYKQAQPGNEIGLAPRIHFTAQYLSEQCKRAALQKEYKDLSFCKQLPVQGYYKDHSKRYGIRKSRTYQGKPHKTHIRVFKKKHQHNARRCKCYKCGEEGHFARDCSNSRGDIARATILDNLQIASDLEVLSVQQDESDSDAICSIVDQEEADEERAFVLLEETGWRKNIKLPEIQQHCPHEEPQINQEIVGGQLACAYCGIQTNKRMRMHCPSCAITVCIMCADFYLELKFEPEQILQSGSKPQGTLIRELVNYINELLAQVDSLQQEVTRLTRMTDDFLNSELKALDETALCSKNEEIILSQSAPQPQLSNRVRNRLYNLTVSFEIPGCSNFAVHAIVDTGATTCCIDSSCVPKEAIQDNKYPVIFHGLNSTQEAKHSLKGGMMNIDEHKFRTPFTYVFPLGLKDGIQMLIGCNFLRSGYGGLRLEGTKIAFYKNIIEVETRKDTKIAAIAELDMEDEEYVELQEETFYVEPYSEIRSRFSSIHRRLEELGIIGEEPLRHWKKNGVLCRLDIINPEITISDRPLKHVTPAMKESFERHVTQLLKQGMIRASTSRHRTMAIIVNSGISIDPKTGKEQRGKERMVFNYKTLNDNTYRDAYSLPGINTILQKVGQSRIYSKFDLKAGFHQVAMDEESIAWTAFIVPGGLYEWLVMPFGLKNAPAIFQRKMDITFKGMEDFVATYIDDILVFSNDEKSHIEHLRRFAQRCEENGIVLSPSKMKIAVPKIDFLGVILGDQKLELQPHIIQKIISFDEAQFKTKKGLRSWLGILNYARRYIPRLGILLGPLHEKTAEHGDKRLKRSDYEIIRTVKSAVQGLPCLYPPPEDSYIILEVDGCISGWGGVCKWKPKKYDPISAEKVCAYASGKFPTEKSTIDAEITACIETLESLKIYYLDRKEITLRTDCQAIIRFHNKTALNKSSRVRWIKFWDALTGTGVHIELEHIDGKNNTLADALSRRTNRDLAKTLSNLVHFLAGTEIPEQCRDVALLVEEALGDKALRPEDQPRLSEMIAQFILLGSKGPEIHGPSWKPTQSKSEDRLKKTGPKWRQEGRRPKELWTCNSQQFRPTLTASKLCSYYEGTNAQGTREDATVSGQICSQTSENTWKTSSGSNDRWRTYSKTPCSIGSKRAW